MTSAVLSLTKSEPAREKYKSKWQRRTKLKTKLLPILGELGLDLRNMNMMRLENSSDMTQIKTDKQRETED